MSDGDFTISKAELRVKYHAAQVFQIMPHVMRSTPNQYQILSDISENTCIFVVKSRLIIFWPSCIVCYKTSSLDGGKLLQHRNGAIGMLTQQTWVPNVMI